MKEYWEYTEQERARMTDEQVISLLDVELMTKGVLKPTPPTLKEIPANPIGERVKYFGIAAKGKYGQNEHLGVCFDSLEAAEKFIALKRIVRDYEYEVGSDYKYAKMIDSAVIEPEQLYTLDQINGVRSVLKQRKALTEENEKALREFNEASAKSEKITDGVWKDYYQLHAEMERLQGVITTYKDYLKLTSGDESLAVKFLGKAHSAPTIFAAMDWFPGEIPEIKETGAIQIEG